MTDTDTTEGKGGEAVRGSHYRNYENAEEMLDSIVRHLGEVSRAISSGDYLAAGRQARSTQDSLPNSIAMAQVYATLAAADATRRLADVQEAALLFSQLHGEVRTIEDEPLSWDQGTANERKRNEHISWRNTLRAEVRRLLGR